MIEWTLRRGRLFARMACKHFGTPEPVFKFKNPDGGKFRMEDVYIRTDGDLFNVAPDVNWRTLIRWIAKQAGHVDGRHVHTEQLEEFAERWMREQIITPGLDLRDAAEHLAIIEEVNR